MVVVPIVDRIIPPKPRVPVPVVKPVTPVAPATPAPVRPDIVQPVVEQVFVDQATLQAEETVVPATDAADRKSVASDKSVSGRLDVGGGRNIEKKNYNKAH